MASQRAPGVTQALQILEGFRRDRIADPESGGAIAWLACRMRLDEVGLLAAERGEVARSVLQDSDDDRLEPAYLWALQAIEAGDRVELVPELEALAAQAHPGGWKAMLLNLFLSPLRALRAGAPCPCEVWARHGWWQNEAAFALSAWFAGVERRTLSEAFAREVSGTCKRCGRHLTVRREDQERGEPFDSVRWG